MKRKAIYVFVPIFLSLVIVCTAITPYIYMSENISENVFRLHILANSNEDYDQKLKLKVRDRVLELTKSIYSDCNSVEEAITASENNIECINEAVLKVIKENGYSYTANVKIVKEYFETRVYDGFTLPAGVYNSLKIEIGKGMGKNWWCVMFPSVCLSGCVEDFDKSLTDDEIEMIENDKYVIRFKFVEIYERIKNRV